MKKIICLFLLMAFSVSLFACAQNGQTFTTTYTGTNNTVNSTTNSTTNSTIEPTNIIEAGVMRFESRILPYGRGYMRYNNIVNDMDDIVYEPYTQIVLSVEGLGGKLEEYCNWGSKYDEEFFEMFDEVFFEKYALVCIGTNLGSSSDLPEAVCVKSIEKGEKIEVEYYVTNSPFSENDITSATIILIFDKDTIDGNETIVKRKVIW